jgi:hypothetical protein
VVILPVRTGEAEGGPALPKEGRNDGAPSVEPGGVCDPRKSGFGWGLNGYGLGANATHWMFEF